MRHLLFASSFRGLPARARLLLLAAVSLPVLAVLGACSQSGDGVAADGDGADGSRVVVAASLPLLAELAERIGGDRVEVITLVPLGVDEHAYQPPTTLPRELVRADLVLVNGYYLEESLLDIVVENVREGVPVVAAARGLTLLEGGHTHEFVEGEAERAAIDVAVGQIGAVVEDALSATIEPGEAIDRIEAIIHGLPSRSRTEVIRQVDSIVHEVPRGEASAEEAVDRIADVTRNYEPSPGPEAGLAQVTSLRAQHEAGSLTSDQVLAEIDALLDRIALDQRNEEVRDIDAALAAWTAGNETAEGALTAIDSILEGHDHAEGAPVEVVAEIDDLVFAEGDPHLWLDARNMAVYAENVRDALIRIDPEGAVDYETAAAALVQELELLHDELLRTLSTIADERRRLVVFHDAFQYFAAVYDFEVVASVAPANPNQERSAAAIAAIIEQVRDAGVPTIYREPQYRSQSLDLIAADSGTRIGVIHSIPSPDLPTYAEMMRANALALVEGLAADE